MEVFARIINLPQTQCLLVREYDTEEEAFKVNVTMIVEGVQATVGLGFEEDEEAEDCFKKFSKEDAIRYYETTLSMFEDGKSEMN